MDFIVEDMQLAQQKSRGKLLAKHSNAWYRFCIAELELARLAIQERDMARFTKEQLEDIQERALLHRAVPVPARHWRDGHRL